MRKRWPVYTTNVQVAALIIFLPLILVACFIIGMYIFIAGSEE